MHPQSSKSAYSNFVTIICWNLAFWMRLRKRQQFKDFFYLVIKQDDVVKIIKQGRQDGLQPGKDYGLLAYNENPFYEVIENGISSIGIDWNEMGAHCCRFCTQR